MGPRVGLDRCGKSRSPPEFDPRTVQPVASRYTDYATRTTELKRGLDIFKVLWLLYVPKCVKLKSLNLFT